MRRDAFGMTSKGFMAHAAHRQTSVSRWFTAWADFQALRLVALVGVQIVLVKEKRQMVEHGRRDSERRKALENAAADVKLPFPAARAEASLH